jgi:tRNA modification GTPase
MIKYKEDTITAISTPIGQGAISIVRLSGKKACFILDRIFSKDVKKLKAKTTYLGNILNEKNELIDKVVVIINKAPNSYTAEDLVEIHCHGGRLITQKVLDNVLKNGARCANPGEFTMRAYLNRKLDLIQAMSVQDLISAKNELALKAAKDQLEGKLSLEIKAFQKDLIFCLAMIEANLDFPEEEIDPKSLKEAKNRLDNTLVKMQKLSNTFDNGKVIKDGLSLCIIGKVNVGKSSLMNALLKKNRAIITDIAGTTRDVLKEDIKINDMNYELIDTAGIRKTSCLIEKEGIKRSNLESKNADIILLVLDSSKDLTKEDNDLIENLDSKKSIIIWNKIDLKNPEQKLNYNNIVKISAKENKHLDSLYKAIEKISLNSKISKDQVILTHKRHKNALDQGIEFLKEAISNLKNNHPLEIIAIDLRSSLKELNKIIGFDITEDVISTIFSNFCIGK